MTNSNQLKQRKTNTFLEKCKLMETPGVGTNMDENGAA